MELVESFPNLFRRYWGGSYAEGGGWGGSVLTNEMGERAIFLV